MLLKLHTYLYQYKPIIHYKLLYLRLVNNDNIIWYKLGIFIIIIMIKSTFCNNNVKIINFINFNCNRY